MSVFLICLAPATLEKNRQRVKIHLFVFLVCFFHLPWYGYIGEKQTRKNTPIYLSCLFFSSALLRLHWRKTDKRKKKKKKPIYLSRLFFSSALLRLHWRKTDKKKHTYLSLLSVFLISLATATLEKNRQEKHTCLSLLSVFLSSALLQLHWRKIDKKNTSIYLYCLFFSSALLRLHWRKIDKKKNTYLSFLSVFLICLLIYPSAHLINPYASP